MIEAERRCGRTIQKGDIVMIQTDADKKWGLPEYFDSGCGMGREATLYLIERGVKVMASTRGDGTVRSNI